MTSGAAPQPQGVGSYDADGEGPRIALSEERQAIFQRLDGGATAGELLVAFTDFVDGLVIGRYRNAMRTDDHAVTEAGLRHCCLVALGGYGRRELFPFSDVDLMFLYRKEAGDAATVLATSVWHHLWDVGFQVGHSTRTVADCLELGAKDLTVRTSMMEARFLTGSPELFQEFRHRFARKVVTQRPDWYIQAKLAERQREYDKFGETVYLLEPNVKRSQGGLRDLHLLQWVAQARHGVGTLAELVDRGLLSRADFVALSDAREFVWRVRACLHHHAGMAQDILSFDEQVWLSEESWQYQDRSHLRGVEQFMQQYYQHTTAMHDLSHRFVERCRSVSAWTRVLRWLPATRIEGVFVVEGSQVTVPDDVRTRVLTEPILLMRLFETAQARDLVIDPHVLDMIHQRMGEVAAGEFVSPDTHAAFLRILAGPGPVAETLSAMHKVRVLEQFIPAFATVRGLMQFNQYHKYTVDEHSLLAVAKAEALAQEQGMLGQVYREIERKDLLHLAVLLHDLGKGLEEDHSEVGKRLAEELAVQLGLSVQDRRTLVFLVHKHLLMAHTAFRRDPYDHRVLRPFVRAVGTPAVLRMLLILTASDIAAVGPGVLTKWKEALLVELFLRAVSELNGERLGHDDPKWFGELVQEVKAALVEQGEADVEVERITEEVSRFPLRYIHATSPKRMAAQLVSIRRLNPGEVAIECEYHADLGTCAYTVLTWNTLTSGIFSKVAGTLAVHGLGILDAQILTREDGLVLDTFQVQDPDSVGAPPLDRQEAIAGMIRRVLKGVDSVPTLLSRGGRLGADRDVPALHQQTEVALDHESSEQFEIIDIFADDRQGLLYVIAKAMVELGLSVHAARISTRLDQVADVFYVTDAATGGKLDDVARREQVRAHLTATIEDFTTSGASRMQAQGSS